LTITENFYILTKVDFHYTKLTLRFLQPATTRTHIFEKSAVEAGSFPGGKIRFVTF